LDVAEATDPLSMYAFQKFQNQCNNCLCRIEKSTMREGCHCSAWC
jgi:hypothetical protein